MSNQHQFVFIACLAAGLLTQPASLLWAQASPDTAAAPKVDSAVADFSVNPAQLTIGGSNFGASAPTVTVDSLAAGILSNTNTMIVASLPLAVTAGSYALKVTNTTNNQAASFDVTLGATGPVGTSGTAGPVGTTGAVGPQGPAGPAGATGPQGSTGPTGATGPQGPVGLTGDTGTQGPQGPIGATGPQGSAGPAGATGPPGPAGPLGTTGPHGSIGPRGPQGPAGNNGSQGPQGPPGPQGPEGAQGPTGMTFNLGGWTINSYSTNQGSGGQTLLCGDGITTQVLNGACGSTVTRAPVPFIQYSGPLPGFPGSWSCQVAQAGFVPYTYYVGIQCPVINGQPAEVTSVSGAKPLSTLHQ